MNRIVEQTPSEKRPNGFVAFAGTLLMLIGIITTTFLGIFLCLYVVSRIAGAGPSLSSVRFLIFWIVFGAAPLIAGTLLVRASESSQRFWLRVQSGMLVLLALAFLDGVCWPKNWRTVLRREGAVSVDAKALKRTIVSPHLGAAIVKGTNVLWCGTFQLAWNEACRLTGGDLQFKEEHPMVAALNRHDFTREFLDEASYVAMAGFVRDNIQKKIQSAVEEKFRGSFKSRFVSENTSATRPEDVVAYACLYKNLSFAVPFERLDDSLTFEGVRVPAFGFGSYKPQLEPIYPQVLILNYRGEDDFVIELKTKDEGDRVILAKVQPRNSLGETIGDVGERIARGHRDSSATNDVLQVPRMRFDITREFNEIEGLHFLSRATNVSKNLVLIRALQNTRLEMNEKGVELTSESHMSLACAGVEPRVPRHRMIFDKPFLMLMQRRGAATPYFALWVDNPEILITWK